MFFIRQTAVLYVTNCRYMQPTAALLYAFLQVCRIFLHFKNKMIFIEIDQTFFFHFSEFDG